jgi:hypothetical protein
VIDPRSIGEISSGHTIIYQMLCNLSPSLGTGRGCRGADEAQILKNQAKILQGPQCVFSASALQYVDYMLWVGLLFKLGVYEV